MWEAWLVAMVVNIEDCGVDGCMDVSASVSEWRRENGVDLRFDADQVIKI